MENVSPGKGMLLILSGPSGVGKGVLSHLLLERDTSFALSCSATTRAPREGEIDGVHYHFMEDAQFDRLVQEDAFLEYADVHGHRYGTLKSAVNDILSRGKSVILEIDTQGAQQVMSHAEDYVSVFILPPSMEALQQRLKGRGSETEEELEQRLSNARQEMQMIGAYQYAVINDSLEEAYADLFAIIQAEKHRVVRYQPTIPEATL